MGSSSFTIEPPSQSASGFTVEPPQKKTWLDSAKDFGSELWNQVNPIQGIKGAAQMAAHPISTYVADAANRQPILDKAEASFKKGDYAEGMAHALYGIIPFLGPQLERGGEQFQSGEIAKGLGTTTGIAANLAAPELIKKVNIGLPAGAPKIAERMYQSALKPSTTLPAGKVAGMVQTGLEAGIPVSEAGAAKLGSLIDDLQQNIKAEIASAPNRPISRFAVASRLGDTADQFKNQVNPAADLEAVQKSGTEFMQSQPAQIPAAQAQALKQGTYQQLKGRSYGELKSATIESQKALARGLKEELATAFPEISGLNAQESRFIGLDQSLEKAVSRIQNHQLLGIGTPLAGVGAKAITGSTPIGAATAVLKAVMDDPVLKSKLAIALNRVSKGGVSVGDAQARVAGYANALGNAATSQPDENQ